MKKIISIISLGFLISCGLEPDTKEGNRLVVTDKAYYIYYDNSVIKLNNDTYLTKESKMSDYFVNSFGVHIKDEKKLLVNLSKYFPHNINSIYVGDAPSEYIEIPTIQVGEKNIVDSVSLANKLLENTLDSLVKVDNISEIIQVKDTSVISPEISLEGKTIVILNGNGINGFATKLGKEFNKNLKMNYVAENYKNKTDYSYVINHRLSEDQINKLVNSISLKYIKIKNDKTIRPEADVVLITGNDKNVTYTLNIVTKTGKSELKEILSDYDSVIRQDENVNTNDIIINYKPEDEIIAKKLLSYFPEAKLIKDDKLENNVTIISPR